MFQFWGRHILQSEVRGLIVMMKNSPHLLYKVGPKHLVLEESRNDPKFRTDRSGQTV